MDLLTPITRGMSKYAHYYMYVYRSQLLLLCTSGRVYGFL